ncbi:MAG TPA: MBOAT family O-acyltransferase [Reyranella sp.]|jgi:D-alanyl-lipoteichoic acid acyltransferase DltB (MBOAT superfamily)
MIFLNQWFLAVCAALFVIGRLPPSRVLRAAVLILANLVVLHLTVGNVLALWPVLALAAMGYASLFFVRQSRGLASVAIIVVVAFFLFVKRYPPFDALPTVPAAMAATVGLSYVLFRALHVMIDFRDRSLAERPSITEYFNYNFLFLSFLSGPIQRLESFSGSSFLDRRVSVSIEDFGLQVARIVTGLFKILVLSGVFEYFFRTALSDIPTAPDHGVRALWIAAAIVAFVAYLYANFSGYMDVVVAVGRLLGLDLPENFDRPFSAANIQEFWQRWHITLSLWVRIYLFGPLQRYTVERTATKAGATNASLACTFIAFFVIGAWHSPSVSGLVYGALLGLGALAHQLYRGWLAARLGRQRLRALDGTLWYRSAARALTLTHFLACVVCLWPDQAMVARLLGNLPALDIVGGLALVFAAIFVLGIAAAMAAAATARTPRWPPTYLARTSLATAQIIVLVFSTFVIDAPVPGFVYGGF